MILQRIYYAMAILITLLFLSCGGGGGDGGGGVPQASSSAPALNSSTTSASSSALPIDSKLAYCFFRPSVGTYIPTFYITIFIPYNQSLVDALFGFQEQRTETNNIAYRFYNGSLLAQFIPEKLIDRIYTQILSNPDGTNPYMGQWNERTTYLSNVSDRIIIKFTMPMNGLYYSNLGLTNKQLAATIKLKFNDFVGNIEVSGHTTELLSFSINENWSTPYACPEINSTARLDMAGIPGDWTILPITIRK